MSKADSIHTTAMSATPHGSPVDSPIGKPASGQRAKKKRTTKPRRVTTDGYIPIEITPEAFFEALGKLRREARDEIELLLAFLDRTEPCPDLEPSLGTPEPNTQEWKLRGQGYALDQRGNQGGTDDCEVEDDREPDDHDEDGGDDEPSLGSACTYGAYNDQSAWVGGGGTDDLEDECEGEGEACEDEGAIDGDSEPDADGEQCGLTVSDNDAARMRRKSGGTGIANIEIDYSEWYGTAVRLPSGEVIR